MIDLAVTQHPGQNVRQAVIGGLARLRVPLGRLAAAFMSCRPVGLHIDGLDVGDRHFLAQLDAAPDERLHVIDHRPVFDLGALDEKMFRRFPEWWQFDRPRNQIGEAVTAAERRLWPGYTGGSRLDSEGRAAYAVGGGGTLLHGQLAGARGAHWHVAYGGNCDRKAGRGTIEAEQCQPGQVSLKSRLWIMQELMNAAASASASAATCVRSPMMRPASAGVAAGAASWRAMAAVSQLNAPSAQSSASSMRSLAPPIALAGKS